MAAKRNRKLEKGEMVEKNKEKKKRIYYYYEGRIIYIIASDKREGKKEKNSCGIYFLIEEMGQIIINFCWQKKSFYRNNAPQSRFTDTFFCHESESQFMMEILIKFYEK